MGGSVLFQDALAARLDLMALSQQRLSDFLAAHPHKVTPGERGVQQQQQQQQGLCVVGWLCRVAPPAARGLSGGLTASAHCISSGW
jgi:hypothetical protein